MTTPRLAARSVKTWMTDRGIDFIKVSGKTIGFQDLLRTDGVFVLITHKYEWHEQWMTDICRAFKPEQCGFHVEFSPNMLRPKPTEQPVG